MALLSFEDALEIVMASARPLGAVTSRICDSSGAFISETVYSPINLPRFDNSQMDGYAVRWSDLSGVSRESPVSLRVVGVAAAGPGELSPISSGEAAKIFTGAPVPSGADTVIPIEDVVVNASGEQITLTDSVEKAQFVRLRGQDLRSGELVCEAGDRMDAGRLALLSSVGRGHIKVVRRPKVVVVTNGDELVPPSTKPEDLLPGQIYESNGVMLSSLVQSASADLRAVVNVKDSAGELVAQISKANQIYSPDLIISTGGVSVGDRDLLRSVLAELGVVKLWRAAIRPGKPILYGSIGEAHFLGLPGNPASSFVTFELFARPLLSRLSGGPSALEFLPATAGEDFHHEPGRRSFMRAVAKLTSSGLIAVAAGEQGSHYVSSLAQANALVVIPEDKAKIDKGQSIECLMIGRLQRA